MTDTAQFSETQQLDTQIQDFALLTAPAASSSVLSYSGPREVLVKKAVVLKGNYNPQQISKVSLVAEDKYPLTVSLNPTAKSWQVDLASGFQTPGTRWLRLRGLNSAGKAVNSQVIYLNVSTNPLTTGRSLSLKIMQDTLFKTSPTDSSKLKAQQKVNVAAGTMLQVARYGYVDGHLKVELAQAIAPVGNFGYFYEPHVQLSKGEEILRFAIDDVPTTPLNAQLLVTTTTFIKSKPADAATLPVKQKAELLQGQNFQIVGYASVAGHYRITLAQPIQGFGTTGYIYWKHVQIKKGNSTVIYDPYALTVAAIKPTLFKKRPVDSAALKPEEKFDFPVNKFYGVSSYTVEAGHLKVALTEELPGFGNTGFLFPSFVLMKRGGRPFNPVPPQVELSVPYFSQRDNPRYSWSTCNVTSIAMAFYYYGVRARNGGQLEDELLQWCINKAGEGSQTDHNILSQLIKAYGFQTSFSTTRQWVEVKSELINRRPVILGGDFTASGHIVCLIGFTPQGYIVNDPWGDALTGYTDTEGRKLIYPYSYIDRVAGPDGKVWAHFISR
ncbi:C39 family peptidase [Leptothermofonsia sp. ETS-13]|uniref:C39 family peptidase n=1 Tax=Leptothermofonsia sp. ETS-13 TaxID=3035696 RepID=UPI003B9FDF42